MKITKGFKGVRKQVEGKGRSVARCNSCCSFFQGEGDSEECCHNNEVTKFDMVEEPDRVYCTFWNNEEDKER